MLLHIDNYALIDLVVSHTEEGVICHKEISF